MLKTSRWMVTLWEMEDVLKLREHLLHYWVIGRETCPTTGKEHYHAYFEFRKEYKIDYVKRLFGKTIHAEIALQDRDTCRRYCVKNGNIISEKKEDNIDDVFEVFGIKIK